MGEESTEPLPFASSDSADIEAVGGMPASNLMAAPASADAEDAAQSSALAGAPSALVSAGAPAESASLRMACSFVPAVLPALWTLWWALA